MEDSEGKKSLFGVTGVLLVSAAIGGWLWVPPGWKSFRPPVPTDEYVHSLCAEDVPARLWQDPFKAVLDYRRKLHEHRKRTGQAGTGEIHESYHQVSVLAKSLFEHKRSRSILRGHQIIVMPVMVPGGQYAESVEERRRQRYAVIAALGRNGLVPQNDQSVGFLETRWTGEGTLLAGPEDEDDPPHISIDVPFEWYSESLDDKTFIQQHKTDHTQLKQENIPAGQRRQEVLVLWLNESQFGQRPLSMVSQLFDKLFEHYGTNPFTGDRIRLAVIGPATSTSLEALLEEIAAKARDMPETDSKAKDKKDSIEPTEQYFPDLSDDHRQLVEFFDFYLDEAVPATPEELVVAETLIKQRLDKVSSSKYERSDVWAAALLSAETDLRDSLSKLAWVNKVEDIDSNWLQTTLSLWRIARLELLPAQGSYRLANHLVEILSLEEPIAFHSETDSAALQTSIAAAIAEFRPEVWYVKEKEAFLNSILKTLRSNASLTEMNLEAAVDFWSDEAIPWSMGLPVDSTSYLEFISSRATIWPRLMSKEAQQALTLMENEKGSNGGSKHTETVSFELPKFSRTISNDRQLIAMLLSEFSDRSMHFGSLDEGSRDHVALIGEWDTHYGRAFPATFRAALCEQFNTSLEDSKKSDKKETQEGQRQPLVCTNPDLLASEFDNIHQFQYLRGIDGLIPGDEPKESEKSEKRQESARIDVAVLQRPDGRSQLDYIGRLCDQISTRERQVFPGGLGHFKIIGVVGSDVYDKQLILQALRARFPRAVFFTTDLDARLTHNNQYHWSRNLLIASSFGLSLNQSLQGAIPPFRGSYQTSTFLACQLALGPIQLKDPETGTSVPLSSKHIEKHLVVPRLYEVARGGAYDISRFDNPNQWTLHSPVKQKSQSILGLRTDMLLASGFSALLFSAAIVGCFMRKKRSKARLSAELRRRVITLSISFLLMLTILTFVVWLDSSKLGGEPFELLQGVSVWPTQFLRFAVGFMCIAFLLSAACDLRRSNDYLERRYRFSEEESTKHQIVNDDASLADDAAPEDSGPEAGDAAAPAPTDPTRPAKEIWRSTRELGKREMRLKRILLALLIYIVFTNVAMMLFGPPASPVRSSTARITDFLMIVFSSSTLAVLSLFVLDTNRLCARMIRQFKTTNTSWPPTAIKRVKQERGLEREEAAEWLEVQFIAERTAVVGRFVVLPFIAFFFLLISRNSYFDLWLWPFSLLLVFGVLSVFIIASGLILRRAAESSRQTSLLILSKLRSRFTGSEDKKEQRRHAQIELTIEELKNLKTGAFAPWSQHPLVRAIILPFGGAGTVLVLEVLSKLGM